MPNPVYARVAVRDNWTCQRCGKQAWDLAHILPRGRFPELKHEEKNIVCLCRDCHMSTENVEGRCELIALMRDRHNYSYEEEQYSGYIE